jgi:NADH:ubiquinone oxidoreductase subunit F (NADH-binding)/NADH:ubiquinone oxidoreductase subunit E
VGTTGTAKLFALNHERRRWGIYDELRAIQARFGYLPQDQLKEVAEKRQIDLRDLHSVATFYPHFHMAPPKRATVAFCDDMTCHLRGSASLRPQVETQFDAAERDEITFKSVSCLGRCDAAPAIAINDHIMDGMTPASVVEEIHKAIGGIELSASAPRLFHKRPKSDPYVETEAYGFLRDLVHTRDFTGVIAKLKEGELRGMGGAGFPAHIKWDLVRKTPSDEKFIICNADESEPGTIKDRFIMMHMAHVLVEGMIIAGLTVGAKHGWIYIRHEYEHAAEILQKEIHDCYAQGLLGSDILGKALEFHLDVFISPGGYICGEVSALLEAMEGKRAEPRDKPPQTGTHGLWLKPTLAHNVETLTCAVAILVKGADWYKAQGRNGAHGMKFVGVTGNVNNPGAYEVPFGITYTELINTYAGGISGGKKLLGFAPSGPSSGYLPASMADLPMEWGALSKVGSMVGSSAVVVCAEDTCMLDMAFNSIRFFRNESCGKCVPCRVGTEKMTEMLAQWMRGEYRPQQMEAVKELSEAMKSASICGLGQIAPVPVMSVLKHFPEQVKAHLERRECPSGVCFQR